MDRIEKVVITVGGIILLIFVFFLFYKVIESDSEVHAFCESKNMSYAGFGWTFCHEIKGDYVYERKVLCFDGGCKFRG